MAGTTQELITQTARLEDELVLRISESPGVAIAEYMGQLADSGWDEHVARTAVWNLIVSQRVVIESPGNRLSPNVVD